MKLSEKQRMFTRMVGDLITFAYGEGYELTVGDFYRDPRVFGEFGEKRNYSASKSVHKVRLAGDLNLWVNDEYITSSDHPAWDVLHDYWDRIGGAPRIPNDANHFSVQHWGVR